MNHTTTMTIVTTDAAGAEVFRASKALPTDLDPKAHFGTAVAAAEAVLSDMHRHCFRGPIPPADIFAKEATPLDYE